MNNLCCLLKPQTDCYYCKAVWCRHCWSLINFNGPKVVPDCAKGRYPSEAVRGGHYTKTYGHEAFYGKADADKFRIPDE